MLQSDIWIAEFENGRTLAVAGQYTQALPVLKRALPALPGFGHRNGLRAGSAGMQTWIGEAQAGAHNSLSLEELRRRRRRSGPVDQGAFR